MARQRSAPPPRSGDEVDTLIGVVKQLGEQVNALTNRVQELTDAIDDIRHEIGLTVADPLPKPPITHITSLPKDPLAPDFGERINAVKPEDLPPELMGPEIWEVKPPPGKGTLW